VDPHHIDADPDPACHFDADPDPAFQFDPDTDPAYHFDADPIFKYDADPCGSGSTALLATVPSVQINANILVAPAFWV
jgi:hypothetical protein